MNIFSSYLFPEFRKYDLTLPEGGLTGLKLEVIISSPLSSMTTIKTVESFVNVLLWLMPSPEAPLFVFDGAFDNKYVPSLFKS